MSLFFRRKKLEFGIKIHSGILLPQKYNEISGSRYSDVTRIPKRKYIITPCRNIIDFFRKKTYFNTKNRVKNDFKVNRANNVLEIRYLNSVVFF